MKFASQLLGAVAMALSFNVFALEPVAFEVVIAKPKANVPMAEFLAADKEMETKFVAKQKGFKSREVAVSKDGVVFVIVHWASLNDAEDAADAFMKDPTAKRRNELGDMSLFSHYIKQ